MKKILLALGSLLIVMGLKAQVRVKKETKKPPVNQIDKSKIDKKKAIPKVENKAFPKVENKAMPKVEHKAIPKVEHKAIPKVEHKKS